MKLIFNLLISALIIFLTACSGSRRNEPPVRMPPAGLSQVSQDTSMIDLLDSIPLSPKVTKGRLDNGLTYYIRHNGRPENRVELRLVVNAGSILENEKQQGLAHFLEHMAFNGTKNFQKQELVNYLESVGMRFGPDINAYTSFDETVYMLQLPTDSAHVLEKGFQVLADWARNLSLDTTEIDNERGVVIEEWRLRRGASARIQDKQFPVLFKNSRYAERLPIGQKAVLDTFHYETIGKFYKDWYRPSLMAVIIVGDVEADRMQSMVREYFSAIPRKENAPERKIYSVPAHDTTLFSIVTDPEASISSVSIYYKLPVAPERVVGEYRRQIVERIYNNLFNERLNELTRQQNAPFLFASSNKSRLVRGSEAYYLAAATAENQLLDGFEALLSEAKRVRQYGFTATELEREKKSLLRSMERAYQERDKMESRQFASEYIRNFLYQEPIPGLPYEYRLYKQFVPGISLQEVNQLSEEWLQTDSRVVLASMPEKEEIQVPAPSQFRAVMDSVQHKTVEPYVDEISEAPLLENPPEPGSISSERKIEEIGVTVWELANGVRIILKPTDFKNDEIRFTAFSPGGMSLIPDSLIIPAETVTSIVGQSGLGDFNETQLRKLLADKVVRVSPYLSELTEGFNGSASPSDLTTLFQLIYLNFTAPRADSASFAAYKERMRGMLENRSASPQAAFQDTITATITRGHPRYRTWTVETLRKMDMMKSLQIYRERFANPGDFTFIFVGNFTLDQMRPLVRTYLGGLNTQPQEEKWQDVTYDYPTGVIRKNVEKGLEPKSMNALLFTGNWEYSQEKALTAGLMLDVLRIMLRERLREALGGTYGVSVRGDFDEYPRERYSITISLGSDPERTGELTREIFA
ncbi:MAG: insulinase family protein, partial [Calditrichia bacterium]